MTRYPIGKQDFKSLREGGYAYVDKTSFIPKLIEGSTYYFLGRPRRFGKSLFLSTLEYFFLGERELFKDLAIDSYPWSWEEYPVIRIDLNGADFAESPGALSEKLSQQLSFVEEKYGIENKSNDLIDRFYQLIRRLSESRAQKVVVLVDEYEKPVIDAIGKPEIHNKNKEFLRGFYSVLKSLDKYLNLVFLTGVTKFGQMSVFSGLNNIDDISMDDAFGAVCGITETELKENFQEGISAFAERNETTREGALVLLKENYDGYHFSERCPDLYNPYSLIKALSKNKIGSYWSLSGTPNLLATMLLEQKYDLGNLNGIRATERRLMGIGNQFEDPVALLYHTGYLTIKSYDRELEEYVLGFPNKEVEQAFFEYLLPNYTSGGKNEVESRVRKFKRYITEGDPVKAMEEMEAFSASISYELIPHPEIERHFQALVYMFASLSVSANVKVYPEKKTSDGRIDLLIETPRFVYIIEIKRDQNPEVALRQIEEKNYALQFKGERRKIFLIGLNFSSEKKRLDGIACREYDF